MFFGEFSFGGLFTEEAGVEGGGGERPKVIASADFLAVDEAVVDEALDDVFDGHDGDAFGFGEGFLEVFELEKVTSVVKVFQGAGALFFKRKSLLAAHEKGYFRVRDK